MREIIRGKLQPQLQIFYRGRSKRWREFVVCFRF